MTYPQGDMSWQLFAKVIEQLPKSTIVVPFFRGESLLHPRFADMMVNLRKFGDVQFATNGDNLTGPNIDAILETCSFVSLSLHSFKYPRQTGNISFFYRALGNGVKTQVSILDSLVPKRKKRKFVKAWRLHVDRVRIYVEHSHKGFGDVERNVLDDGRPCVKPFEDMVVYWDGKVGLCNHDWNNGVDLGDLNVQTVAEAWNNNGYNEVRRLHQNGLRHQVASCKSCDYWMVSYLPKKMFGELYVNG